MKDTKRQTNKAKAGERIIPMLTAVSEVLLTEYERSNKSGCRAYQTDGYADFVFCTRLCEQGVNIRVIQDVMAIRTLQSRLTE